MSEQTIKGIKDAIQAHLDEVAERKGEQPQFLLEFAIGYVTMKQGSDGFTYNYLTDPHSTPHSSVGLFAMAAGQLDLDLEGG